jgi:putative tryptophan/tyrosine transport system substrate-binding protein
VITRRRFVGALAAGALTPPFAPAPPRGNASQIKQVGWLAHVPLPHLQSEFKRGLQELGYTEGSGYVLRERYAGDHLERLAALAAELVALPLDVVVAEAIGPARAAQQATTSIPIVFITGDPVTNGLVRSLAHPGGNLTGVANLSLELYPKRVEILKAALPNLHRLAILAGPTVRPEVLTRTIQEAVGPQGIQAFPPMFVSRSAELDDVFTRASEARADAILVSPNPFFNSQKHRLVALAARHRLPALHEFRDFVEAGGFMCYGADNKDVDRRVATYVDRILRGAKPADLPVEQPTKFELVINLKTAKALGLTIPPPLLARADQVIE